MGRCRLCTADITADGLLLVEGDTGNEMYVLIDGVLEVFKQAGGEEVILQRLDEPGAHIGDMALLESGSGVRIASVRSTRDSRVLVVPKEVFLDAMQLNPAVEEQLGAVHHRQIKQLSLVEQSVMYRPWRCLTTTMAGAARNTLSRSGHCRRRRPAVCGLCHPLRNRETLSDGGRR